MKCNMKTVDVLGTFILQETVYCGKELRKLFNLHFSIKNFLKKEIE